MKKPIRPAGLEPATYGSEGNPKSPPKSPETPVKSEVYAQPRPVARAGEHDPRFAKIFGISAPCAEDSAQSRSPPTSGRNPGLSPPIIVWCGPSRRICFEINSKSLYLLTRPTLQPKFPTAWEGFSSSLRCFIKGPPSLFGYRLGCYPSWVSGTQKGAMGAIRFRLNDPFLKSAVNAVQFPDGALLIYRCEAGQ
jgi:hypothetical protein